MRRISFVIFVVVVLFVLSQSDKISLAAKKNAFSFQFLESTMVFISCHIERNSITFNSFAAKNTCVNDM